ncbi:cysteine desulfurase [Acidimicrobiia bacterium EGI L10123]|uniref:cysteine desulfurase family protein n=1 Tax=Salinilacustrithrix flava TaxID=2957203 RepID=UPI003D7C21C5|nr:cysteine desulfurase [Acidimicrobiia bacterium EGI L10123]
MAYLDHAATTPVRPEARDAMLPWLGDRTGNPSGAHRLARDARRAIDDARDTFAEVTGFDPGDIVFTAGGTEADNLAVLGVLDAVDRPGATAACPASEHHAVLEAVEHRHGRIVRVRADGRVDLDHLAELLDDTVAVVSVMAVNNETGVIADLHAVLDLVVDLAPGAVVHTDAVQALTWLDLPAATTSPSGRRVDLLSLSAHKFGGPQGVGVLAVRAGTPLQPRLLGGGQERGRRSGTQNVAGIVGAAAAARTATDTRAETVDRLGALRDRLADGLHDAIDGLVETAVDPVTRDRAGKIAGSCHVCIPGIEAEALLVLLEDRDVFASAASSCASGAQDPSHVLAAMGVPRDVAAGSLRLSLGWSSTDADVDAALDAVPAAVERLRSFSPSGSPA